MGLPGEESFRKQPEGCLITRKPCCSQGSFPELTGRQGEPDAAHIPVSHKCADGKDVKCSLRTEGPERKGGRDTQDGPVVIWGQQLASLYKETSQAESTLFLAGPPVVSLALHKSQNLGNVGC